MSICLVRSRCPADCSKSAEGGTRVKGSWLLHTGLSKNAMPPCIVTTWFLRRSDPLLEIAMKLEEVALKDDYFVSRHLYPNVDFYSGIVLRALGIPVSMYTVLFAVHPHVVFTCTTLQKLWNPGLENHGRRPWTLSAALIWQACEICQHISDAYA